MERIGMAVGGKFSSHLLSNQLVRLGHEVHVLSSLPKSRYGISEASSQEHFIFSELIFRLSRKLGQESLGDLLKMRLLSQKSQRVFKDRKVQTVFAWSSFAKELFLHSPSLRKILVRESCHIRYQWNLLENEYKKFGVELPDRTAIIEREEAEYQLCDKILVPSHFAKRSFIREGVAEEKIAVLPMGIDLGTWPFFQSNTASRPLKILYIGNLSVRKGIPYLLDAVKQFSRKNVLLTLVGPMERGLEVLVKETSQAQYLGPLEKKEISRVLQEHTLFVLPSIEDGYGMALIEALASGLVPITTTHVGAHEWLTENVTGKICAPASKEALSEAIEYFLLHPSAIKEMQEEVKELRPFLSEENHLIGLREFMASLESNLVSSKLS